MYNSEKNGKGGKQFGGTGYDLGLNLRRQLERRISSLGDALNAGQHQLGTRTTGTLLTAFWLLAFLYFTHLFLSLFV